MHAQVGAGVGAGVRAEATRVKFLCPFFGVIMKRRNRAIIRNRIAGVNDLKIHGPKMAPITKGAGVAGNAIGILATGTIDSLRDKWEHAPRVVRMAILVALTTAVTLCICALFGRHPVHTPGEAFFSTGSDTPVVRHNDKKDYRLPVHTTKQKGLTRESSPSVG